MPSKANSSKAAIITSIIIGKISSIVGYTLFIILSLPLIFGTYPDAGTVVFVLVLLCGCAALILNGIKIKRRNKRFKKYISLITVENQVSLENIAGSTMQSLDFVMKDIQKMIDKKYFLNAYIDMRTNEIVLQRKNVQAEFVPPSAVNTSVEMVTVSCRSCGAVNSIQIGAAAECEFCGSPLK